LEYRLAEGVKFETASDLEVKIIGTGHELSVKLVRLNSPEEIQARPVLKISMFSKIKNFGQNLPFFNFSIFDQSF